MNNLDESQLQSIHFLHTKIDEYQTHPDLCGKLTSEQYVILAELQTIYNILMKKTISNVPSLYQSDCVGVRNEMKQFMKIYIDMNSNDLYEIYMKKYQEAKESLLDLNQLFPITKYIEN